MSKLRPEETVRQELITQLVERGYPRSLLVVEKKISELPHLAHKIRLPNRRVDILCYAPYLSMPLLLIECKAVRLSFKQRQQLFGYNYHVRAPFVALVSQESTQLFFGTLELQEKELPSYENLLFLQKELCK